MPYSFDVRDNSLVLSGVEGGIAQSPYAGIANLQNVNITTVPGEASVGFATQAIMKAPTYSGVTVTAYGDGFEIQSQGTPLLESYQAVYFTNSTISGINGTTVYYLVNVGYLSPTSTFGVNPTYGAGGSTAIGTTGTATMHVIPFTLGPRGSLNKNYQIESPSFDFISTPNHWIADSNGLVWSDVVKTGTTNSWTYTGNVGNISGFSGTTDSTALGQGMIYYQTVGTNGPDGWIFLWRQNQIDYLKIISSGNMVAPSSLSWEYAWKTGLAVATLYGIKYGALSHEPITTPGNEVAFCDANTVGLFYQENLSTPFDPTNASTYAYFAGITGTVTPTSGPGYNILAPDDVAQCMALAGSYLYIGGQKNVIYPWDMSSEQPTSPFITLPERDIKNLVGVNQKLYIFAGNRGRIYISQGSQADLYAKVPDHISGSVQPLFAWGAAMYSLNQLYFGIFETNQPAGIPASIGNNNLYGGVWGIDTNSNVLYMQNTLSDNSSSSYVCSLLAQNNSEMQGYGLFAGAYSSSGSILDSSVQTPYTNGKSLVDFDLIPIGSLNLPRTNTWIEYKLSTPMVAGESISLYSRTNWNGTWNLIGTDSTAGNFSNSFSTNWNNAQWIQIRAVLTSTGTTPSYVRLKEVRIGGNVGPAFTAQQVLTT